MMTVEMMREHAKSDRAYLESNCESYEIHCPEASKIVIDFINGETVNMDALNSALLEIYDEFDAYSYCEDYIRDFAGYPNKYEGLYLPYIDKGIILEKSDEIDDMIYRENEGEIESDPYDDYMDRKYDE